MDSGAQITGISRPFYLLHKTEFAPYVCTTGPKLVATSITGDDFTTSETLLKIPFQCKGEGGEFHKCISEIKILPISECYQLLAGHDMLKAMGCTLSTDIRTGRPRVDCQFKSHGKAVNMRVAAMAVDETSDEDSVMSHATGVWRLAVMGLAAADEGTTRYRKQCSNTSESCIEQCSNTTKTAPIYEKNESTVCIDNILFLLITGVGKTDESIYKPIMHSDSKLGGRVCHYIVVSNL